MDMVDFMLGAIFWPVATGLFQHKMKYMSKHYLQITIQSYSYLGMIILLRTDIVLSYTIEKIIIPIWLQLVTPSGWTFKMK